MQKQTSDPQKQTPTLSLFQIQQLYSKEEFSRLKQIANLIDVERIFEEQVRVIQDDEVETNYDNPSATLIQVAARNETIRILRTLSAQFQQLRQLHAKDFTTQTEE